MIDHICTSDKPDPERPCEKGSFAFKEKNVSWLFRPKEITLHTASVTKLRPLCNICDALLRHTAGICYCIADRNLV